MSSVPRRIAALALSAPLLSPSPLLAQQASERPVLELSLQDAVKRAMENNLDIAVARYEPSASAEGVRQAEGAYDPLFSSTLSTRDQTSAATNIFAGAQEVATSTNVWNFGLSQPIKTGATFTLAFNNNKQDTNSIFATINPTYSSSFAAGVSQPLLRNFKVDSSRQQLRVAKKNVEISDAQFRQTVINVLAAVKQQYYNLLAAIDNLEAQRKSLSLAQKLLGENRIKVRVGTMAPLDVVAAESEVATRDENVIVAENALAEAEDALRRSIFAESSGAMWNTRIVPTDRPDAEPVVVDVDVAIKKALEQRTDMQTARKNLEITEYTYGLAKNQTLPGLDLAASYGGSGVGGTGIIRDGTGGPIISTVPGGYGDALSDVFGFNLPTWQVGVTLSYPVLNRTAKASAARAQLALDQARTSLTRLEMSIAAEVRTAGRSVETNLKRVASTRAARVLQAQRLDADEKKFAAGMSTNFLVTQAQRDLALAEVAELTAIADYRKSLVIFERVQEAGLGSGGGSITIAVGTAVAGRTSN